ncbi:MAG TPA: hypothetical protein VGP33_01725 [Chloroflexota bacterium]|nr:hypothetical protein [Chloroflexota bacterium]
MASLLTTRTRPLVLLGLLLIAMVAIATRPLLSAAGGDVTVFDVRAFAPISVPAGLLPTDGLSMVHKADTGTSTAKDAPRQVPSLAAATAAVGFTPLLPSGVGAPAAIYVSAAQSQHHSFTAAEVDKALTNAKVQAPQVAALLDGSTAVVDLPAAAGFLWGTTKAPTLALIESPSPKLTLAGASAATLRQALLAAGQTGPEQSLTQQLLAINDYQHTLPVPVPPGASAHSVAAPQGGLLITGSKDGHAMTTLLWQMHGIVYALAEPGASYDLTALAGSLR